MIIFNQIMNYEMDVVGPKILGENIGGISYIQSIRFKRTVQTEKQRGAHPNTVNNSNLENLNWSKPKGFQWSILNKKGSEQCLSRKF